MNENISFLLESLFGTTRLSDVTVDQLRELVDSYPAFSAGHYFLSKKLQQENNEQFQPQTQVTGLYFNNPLWLQWLLNQQPLDDWRPSHEPIEDEKFKRGDDFDNTSYENELRGELFVNPAYSFETDQSSKQDISNQEPQPASQFNFSGESAMDAYESAEKIASPESIEISNQERINQEYIAEQPDWMNKSIGVDAPDEELIEDEEFKEETIHFQPGTNEWNQDAEAEANVLAEESADESALSSQYDNPEELASDFQQLTVPGASEFSELPTHETMPEIDAENSDGTLQNQMESRAHEAPEQISEVEFKTEAIQPEIVEDSYREPVGSSAQFEQIEEKTADNIQTEEPAVEQTEEILQANFEAPDQPFHDPSAEPENLSGEDLARPVDEAESNELLFEPYHTVDYFASQGIKLLQEENPTDRFGKQLKSFTDWLKSMKKLPLMPIPAERNEEEVKIEEIAAHSIEEKDVVTEAMAEVLAKQGKIESAIEIYLKLSLLNPLKIAYFAAKIEELKKNNLS
ncbi:MAG: hypothetical protein C5B59_01550 [Bacteroidetes bacterium]|nr:MAG: hypothetical protein C5B59_01550 [Bacteroidota bacterium]